MSVRTEVLIRALLAPTYTVAQVVIVPVILTVGIVIGVITILNVLVFGSRSGLAFKKPVSRTSLFVQDSLEWNFNNLDRAWRGPLSFFELFPPRPF